MSDAYDTYVSGTYNPVAILVEAVRRHAAAQTDPQWVWLHEEWTDEEIASFVSNCDLTSQAIAIIDRALQSWSRPYV